MKSTGATTHAIGLVVATFFTSSHLLAQDPGWMNLGHLNRGNTYFVILRNGNCLQGTIQSVKPDSLSIAEPNPNSKPNASTVAAPHLVTVARLDTLQVKDGFQQFDILYSGRSSWLDVQYAPSHSREYLSLTLKSGKSARGEPTGSTDSQFSIKRSNTVSEIAKADIALVDYIRIKPAPSNRVMEFPAELFDVRIWPYIFNIGVQMRVPLFNSTLLEDDSMLSCRR
jgi:hypothetical protein